jgi:LPXTG-motif cell wall-anchored protein
MRLSTFSAVLALIVAVVVGFASASEVSAHAHLKSSNPAAGSTISAAPSVVTASFDNHDPLVAEGSALVVTNAAGERVDNGDLALDKSDAERKTLTVSLKSGLGDGVYTVKWTAVSQGDGSTESGEFKFTVRANASTSAPTANLPQTGAAEDGLFVAALFALIALTLGFGLRRFAHK